MKSKRKECCWHENEDFPLRGFVSCHRCGKPLTTGHAKGRSKTYAHYWCWTKGCGGVGISKAELEGHFAWLYATDSRADCAAAEHRPFAVGAAEGAYF
jgi:Recombinase zinc beta ribbon domain